MSRINLWIPSDAVLAAIAPIGLAASVGTGLVVDADPNGPRYPGAVTLAELVARGPRRAELEPPRSGVAILRNGGVRWEDAAEVLAALEKGWPHVAVRHVGPKRPDGDAVAVATDLPGVLSIDTNGPLVVQRTKRKPSKVGDVMLPRPARRLVAALLEGHLPGPSRWVRAWKPVWELR